MNTYKYAKPGNFIQGLPARDLDDKELSDEQRALLAEAVKQGIYLAPIPPATKVKTQDPEPERETKNERTERTEKSET